MVLFPFAIAVGLVLGLLRRGKLENVLGLRPSVWFVLICGLAMLLIGEFGEVPRSVALATFIVGSLTVIYSLTKNTRFTGSITMGIGLVANLVAVVANGHVPVRFDALVTAGELSASATESSVSLTGLREMETADTRLAFLGEIVPVEPLNAAVSFGDLILAAGAVVFAMHLLLARRRRGVDLDTLLGPEWMTDSPPETVDLRGMRHGDEPDASPALDLRPGSPQLRPAAHDGARVFGPAESDFQPPDTSVRRS